MQTICDKTSNHAPHAGNIIDLAGLRRRQALAQRDSLARRPRETSWVPEETSGFRPVVLTATPEERRRARRERRAWCLDVCASLSVILMTAVFALRVLL